MTYSSGGHRPSFKHRIQLVGPRLERILVGALVLLLCLCVLPKSHAQGSSSSPAQASDDDLERCYAALTGADADSDRRVDSEEYVSFLQLYRPGGVLSSSESSITSFAGLPLALQSNFYSLACTCREDETQAEDCCIGDKAHLPSGSSGSNGNETPSAVEQSRLYTICFFSGSALDRLESSSTLTPSVATLDPTPSPTATATATATATGELTVSYTIVVSGIITPGEDSTSTSTSTSTNYQSDLVAAMDDLAVEVASEIISSLDGIRHRLLLLTTTSTTSRIRRRRRRHLQKERGSIDVQLPTSIEFQTDKGGFTMTPSSNENGIYDGIGLCPADLGNPSTDRCEEIVALVEVMVSTGATTTMEKQLDAFRSALQDAILEGRLQESLQRIRPSSIATILSGQGTTLSLAATDPPANKPTTKSPPSGMEEDNTGMTGGATAGIIISACAVVGILGFLFVSRQRGVSGDNSKEDIKALSTGQSSGNAYASDLQYLPMESNASSVSGMSISQSHLNNEKGNDDEDLTDKEEAAASFTLAPSSSPEEAQENTTIKEELREEQVTVEELQADSFPDSKTATSEQSESGWSSDAYNSSHGSVDTEDAADDGSLGEDDDDGLLRIVDLQDIEGQGVSFDSANHPGITNLADLEAAIMVGDWAAVGTSAAALASYDSETSTDGGSFVSGSQGGGSRTTTEEWKSRDTSWQMAMDANKAVELDKLIEQGDWEAVIQAAAKFEAEQTYGEEEEEEESSTDEYYEPSQTTESMIGNDFDDSNSSTGNDEPVGVTPPLSMPEQINNESATSIRSDVIELLRQVVPEEMDNVDEMLSQFEGREEDLIETLKAMEMRKEVHDAPKKRQGNLSK